jgi:hypothetical protein
MFAKVFRQIFDSSIASNHKTRHVFMDLLVLANDEGVVEMTMDAIHRRTNVPLEDVQAAINELCEPDTQSNSPTEGGRRLVRLYDHKDWGWRIVNYEHYRAIRCEQERREYFKLYRRHERQQKKAPRKKNGKPLGIHVRAPNENLQ